MGRVKKLQAASAAELQAKRRRSEHEPGWEEAIIEVQQTLKGAPGTAEVVRFPTSLDVMWVGFPKFRVGQEGIFILRQDRISGAPTAMLEGTTLTAYMATDPRHVRTKEEAETIRRLLNTRP